MAYSTPQINQILAKADRTMYKIGSVAYQNMFSELDEALDYHRDIIYIYKKAVEWGDDYFVGTEKLDKIVERLSGMIAVWDYGMLTPIYNDVSENIASILPPCYFLNDLCDVNITNVFDGQYLVYDSETGQWINTGPGHAVRYSQTFTATANQTVFVTDRPIVSGLYDVFLNGTKLNTSNYTIFGSYTLTLIDPAVLGDIIDIVIYDANVSVATYVPYTGATTNVNLGEWGMNTGFVQLDTTPSSPASAVGKIVWNDSDGTINVGLKGGNVNLQVGQEQVARVVNKTGSNLLESEYKAVRVRRSDEGGSQGQRLAVVLAQANNDSNSVDTLGIVTENIDNNQEGFITTSGLVNGINTTGSLQGETWIDGDVLYLDGTTPGKLTNIKPSAPTHSITMGYVVYAHGVNGKIFVKVDNGYEIDELHNVLITNPLNNQVLKYDSATSLWKNGTITSVGTVTSVDMSVPTGFAISGNPITSSGTLSLAFSSGYALPTTIKQSNWDDAYTFVANFPTQTGNIGKYLTTDGSALSWATISFAGYVPTSRTITINGTAYDLSADRSWSVGTVTSVSALTIGTAGTDISSSVATGTTTPVITLNIPTASALNRGALSSADWSTFSGKQDALTLTTIGTSGAATLVGSTLNIPQYSGTNIYNSDGTLTGDRTVTLSTYNLSLLKTIALATASDGLYLKNDTASTSVNNSYSPSLIFSAFGWGGTNANTPSMIREYLVPISGTPWNQPSLVWQGLNTSNAWTTLMTLRAYNFGGGSPYGALNVGGLNIGATLGQIDNGSSSSQLIIVNTNANGGVRLQGGNQYIRMNSTVGIQFHNGTNEMGRFFTGTGNLLIQTGGTFTDNGFKLDVTGTARVSGKITASGSTTSTSGLDVGTLRFQHFTTNNAFIAENTFYNGTAFQRINTGLASVFYLSNGGFQIGTLTSAAGGTTQTLLNNRMQLSNDGKLQISDLISGGGPLTHNASAVLQADSTTKGFLPPRMTEAQKTAISSPATGLIIYQTDGVSGLWIYNGTSWVNLGTGGGITSLNGLISSTQTFATGTSGTDFNISSSTSTHTFNIPTASSANRGALSSADWSTFNSKQDAITLTTTGTSGAATLVGATLNIPQYQSVLTNPVTGTGTANEISYWTSSSAIGSLSTTTYPSLTELSYVKGVTSSIQTQLDSKQGALTLTTTGTSGAATLIGNTLNIPQYSGGGSMAIGGSITSATAGSVLFAGASGVLAQDNANLFWDDSLNLLGIGTATPSSPIEVYSTSTTYRGLALTQASSDNIASIFTGRKIRGSSAVVNGDFIFNFNASGYDGSAYQIGSAIRWQVDGAVSAGSVPTAIEFRTGSSGVGTQRLLISSAGVSTFSGQVISTSAGSTTTGGGQIYLNGATSNRIDFNTNGGAAPTFTTRSAGTKIVLFPSVTATTSDYALGIENSTLWYSIADVTATHFFKWYAGTTNIMSLSGTGILTLSRNQSTATYLDISNTTSGVTSQAQLILTSDGTAGSANIGKKSNTFTTSGIINLADLAIVNTAKGDIALVNSFASGSIKFAAGGSSTANMIIASTGITTFADNLIVSKNQNALTSLEVSNTTSGTASKVQTLYTSDATAGTAIVGKNSNTFTTSGILNLADMFLVNNTKGDIAILNNFASGAIKLSAGASATPQLTLKTTGQLQLNGYTSTSSFTGTAAGYLAFDSSGNILTTASPSGGNGYTIQFTAQALANFTWGDAATYYIGNGVPTASISNQGRAEVYIPKAGTITAAYVFASFSTAGTSESWTMSILINGTTATTIQAITVSATQRTWSNTALSIAVAAGDQVEIRTTTPIFSTNPVSNTGHGVNATIYIE